MAVKLTHCDRGDAVKASELAGGRVLPGRGTGELSQPKRRSRMGLDK